MIRSILAIGMISTTLAVLPATAEVTVHFVNPERYTDLGDHRSDYPRNKELLEGFFVDSISACLAEGEKLKLDIHNVDLAGLFEHWRPSPGVRKMRNVDAPRIDLHYTHTGPDGSTIGEDSARLTDMHFLQRAGTQRSRAGTQRLFHEKRMIERWVDRTFCKNNG